MPTPIKYIHSPELAMDKTAAKQWWPAILGVLLLAGLLLRVWGAWCIQFSPNSDFGIVALMARHMAMGIDFPVFFYGQPYMGSFEPAVSALLCRLFGVSGFMVCLGTALLGFFALPLVYLLARRMAGPRAALFAILYLLVGSDTNFHYAVAPRGGYMAMLVMGLACILFSIRIARRWTDAKPLPVFDFVAIGLCAGIGWWSNQLVFVFLMPAALLLLPGIRRADFWPRAIIALGAFIIGSAPWWWWNAMHGWASFGFRGSLGSVPVTEGVVSFWYQFLEAIAAWPVSQPLNAIRIALTVAAIGIMLLNLARQIRARQWDDAFWTRLAGALILVVMIAVYSTSHYARFNASRYVLPVIPVFALALSDAFATFVRIFRRPILAGITGTAALLLAVPSHYQHIPSMKDSRAADFVAWDAGADLINKMPETTGGVLYGDYGYHWINFASAERLCIATAPDDRYAPYTLRTETAPNPGYLQNHGRIHAFVAGTRGTLKEQHFFKYSVVYDVTPPNAAWRYMEAKDIRLKSLTHPNASLEPMLDDVLSDVYSIRLEPGAPFAWQARFDRPVSLAGLRTINPQGHYSQKITVSLLGEDSGKWFDIYSGIGTSAWFWSGPRPYPAPFQHFQEIRFPPTEEPVVAARIRLETESVEQRLTLGQWLFLEAIPDQEIATPEVKQLKQVADVAAARNLKRLYAPRWVSQQLRLSGSPLEIALPHAFTRTVQELGRQDEHAIPVNVSKDTGLLCWEQDAPRTRRVLKAFGLAFEEEALPPWHLFSLTDQPAGVARDYTAIYWNETGCWAADLQQYAKTRAHRVYEQKITEDTASAIERLRLVLELYPAHQPALEQIAGLLKDSGRADEAEAFSRKLNERTRPVVPARIRFQNRAEFLGMTVSSDTVPAGESFDITYYWKCPPKLKHERWAFFVHFKSEDSLFQDDHIFMEGVPRHDLVYQPFEEVFTITRRVTVPADAKAGTYTIRAGLYDRRTNERLKKLRTRLPHKRGAVALPLQIAVTRPDSA